MLNNFQKHLYNLHLSTYRKVQKQPYKFRENFENFETERPEDYAAILKLERFFNTYDKINVKLFFNAPYNAHEDVEYYSLSYYTSQGAINAYKIYMTLIKTQSPDSDSQLEFIKDSLKFIKEYCIKHKIKLIDYLNYKEGITFSWAVHIAEKKISIYPIIGFSIFNIPVYDHMFDMPSDEQEMLLGDIIGNYTVYKTQLEKSKNAKKLVVDGLKIIEKSVNENLQSLK